MTTSPVHPTRAYCRSQLAALVDGQIFYPGSGQIELTTQELAILVTARKANDPEHIIITLNIILPESYQVWIEHLDGVIISTKDNRGNEEEVALTRSPRIVSVMHCSITRPNAVTVVEFYQVRD